MVFNWMVHVYQFEQTREEICLLNGSTTRTLTWNDEGHDRPQADWPATYPPVDDFWSVDCPSSPPTCRRMPASFGAVRPQISSIYRAISGAHPWSPTANHTSFNPRRRLLLATTFWGICLPAIRRPWTISTLAGSPAAGRSAHPDGANRLGFLRGACAATNEDAARPQRR